MKMQATSWSKEHSTTEMVKKVTFTAESEVDAVQLAALFNQWTQSKGRAKQLRKEALLRYCKKHNVTITTEE